MKRSCGKKKIVVAGAAVLDAVAVNVGPEVFAAGSSPADRIRLSTGGDALNEATVLARLAAAEEPEREGENSPLSVSLLTVLGEDMAGKLILQHCAECGILVEVQFCFIQWPYFFVLFRIYEFCFQHKFYLD